MLKSALISALSACVAVCTTLLFQKYWLSPRIGPQEHVPVTATTTANTESQQEHQSSSDIPSPPPPGIDLAQALGLGRVLLSRGEQEEAALVYRVAAQAAVALEDAAAGSEGGKAGTNRGGGEAHHGLGLALLAAGRPGEALEACREAERLDSLSAAASSCVGALLTETGDTSGAVQALRRALEKAVVAREGGETVDDIRGRLGGALLDAGEVDEAISVLTSGTTGSNGNVAYNLGVAWQTKGETDKAIVSYTRAAELAPSLAAPRVNLGAQLLQSGLLPEAEVVLMSAVELAHDDPPSMAAAQANLGAVLQRSGRALEALASYTKAVECGAGRSALMRVAKLHQDLGQPGQALEASRRAMRADGDPLDTSPLLQIGLILESVGDIEEAAEHFARVVELDAGHLDATMRLGGCQQRLHRHHEALASYLAASRIEPDNPVIYELLLSAVTSAKRATGEAAGDTTSAGTVGDSSQEQQRQAAMELIDGGALPEQVAKQEGGAGTAGAERAGRSSAASADGAAASEAPAAIIVGEVASAEEVQPAQTHAAGETDTLDQQAAQEAATEAAEEESPERAGAALLPERGAVGPGSGRCRGGADATAGSTIKATPGGSTGASVRQDSAEMRRQSESLGKEDAGATATRGFFGKAMPEGSKDPATVGTSGTSGGGGSGGGTGESSVGAASVAEAGASRPPDASAGGADERVDSAASEHARLVVTGAAGGGNTLDGEFSGVSVGGEFSLEGAGGQRSAEGAPVVGQRASLDSNEVSEVPAVVSVNDGSAEGVSVRRGEGLVVPPPDADALPSSGDGVVEGAAAEEYPAGEESDASISLRADEGQGSTAAVGLESHVDGDGLRAEAGQEEHAAAPTILQTGDFTVEEEGDTTGAGVSEEEGVGSRLAGEAVPGGGNSVPNGPDKDSTVAPADDPSTHGGGNVDSSSGDATAVEDGGAIRAAEEAVADQAGRRGAELVQEAAKDSSSANLADGSDTLAHAAVEDATKWTAGEGTDQSSTAATDPDAEGDSSPEDSIDVSSKIVEGKAAEEAGEEGEDGASASGGTATAADAEAAMATPGQGEDGDGGEEGLAREGSTAEDNDDGAEQAADTVEDVAADSAGSEPGEISSGSSTSSGSPSGEDFDAPIASAATPAESGESVTADAAAAATTDTAAVPVVVSEEDNRRARAKAKLGIAKLNQGQTKKAVSLFEKAASIDPGWWGGFYYAAFAHDTLGNPEAAAGALVSALGVPPTNEVEMAELAELSSKVLATLDGGEKGPVGGELKSAMDASGLSFAVAPPAHEPPPRSSPDRGTDPATPRGGGGGGAGSGVGRTAGMGGVSGGEGAGGAGAASRAGLEADLASRSGERGGAPAPHREGGVGTRPENNNNINNNSQGRWPFAGKAGAGGDDSAGGRPARGSGGPSSRGEGGGNFGGTAQRGEASPPAASDPWGQEQDQGRAREAGRYRDSAGVGGGEGRWERGGGAAPSSDWDDGFGGVAAGRRSGGGGGGGAGGRPFKVDSQASAEEILASMGLKSGVGLGPGGAGARTPEDMMAAGSSSGDDQGGGRKKKGLFGGLWNRKKGKAGK